MLRTLGIRAAGPAVPRVRAIGTTLLYAEIALQEIALSRLRGYGALKQEDAAVLAPLEDPIIASVRELRARLETTV